jgi:hypothetical protein
MGGLKVMSSSVDFLPELHPEAFFFGSVDFLPS